MQNKNVAKNSATNVKRMAVKKLTAAELVKITGGCVDTRDCKGPGSGSTCAAYILYPIGP